VVKLADAKLGSVLLPTLVARRTFVWAAQSFVRFIRVRRIGSNGAITSVAHRQHGTGAVASKRFVALVSAAQA
jgi:hypothetical protein